MLSKVYFLFNFLKDMDFNKMFGREICLADSVIIHMFLQNSKHFSNLNLIKTIVNKILSLLDLIEGIGRGMIILSKCTKLDIYNTLYSLK